MIEGKEIIIREFLMKDDENYNLTSLGFIQDFEKEISFLLELNQDLSMTTFGEWKHQLLNTGICQECASRILHGHLEMAQKTDTPRSARAGRHSP